MIGLQHRVFSSVWRVNMRRIETLCHQSVDLVGTIVLRHRHACWAQRVIGLWLRERLSIPLEPSDEAMFDVLFCSAQV